MMKRLIRAIGRRLANVGREPAEKAIDYRWMDPQSESEAALFLARRLECSARKLGIQKIVLIGSSNQIADQVETIINRNYSVSCYSGVVEFIASLHQEADNLLVGIASVKAAEIHHVATELVDREITRCIPFEYAVIPKIENQGISRMWENSEDFISPLHLEKVDWNGLFEESCTIFDPKTGIRDFMDLIQALGHVISRDLPGNIAEFGSFKGQSGYLVSRFLESIKSEKKLFMFDMFESFPVESIGADHFWSQTHEVDYHSIKNKFVHMKNVQLVKGDFTQTFEKTETGRLALAFVDCDSFRGTKYLIEKIFDDCLVPFGLMLFEDYGHASLLGNRLAVHEYFDRKKNAFCFFSHFSGTYVVCKTF